MVSLMKGSTSLMPNGGAIGVISLALKSSTQTINSIRSLIEWHHSFMQQRVDKAVQVGSNLNHKAISIIAMVRLAAVSPHNQNMAQEANIVHYHRADTTLLKEITNRSISSRIWNYLEKN